MNRPVTWVIGAGGLLGSSAATAFSSAGPVWSPDGPIPWGTPDASSALVSAAHEFFSLVGDRAWQIAWCAGTGVVGSSADDLADEREAFGSLLAVVGRRPRASARGVAFLASSAGGVYAGSRGAPFDERTPVAATSAYGQSKLELERIATEWSRQSGVPFVLGRISNLYGPNQNLGKQQGLISQICRSHLLGRPLSIYVSLDTLRDYLYVDDCGQLIVASLDRARREAVGADQRVYCKVLATQQAVTIGHLVAEFKRVVKSRPRVVFAASPNSRFQVRDLRLRSVVWPDLDRGTRTPLAAGIRHTIDGILRALQAGSLT
ncbi:MAG: NAD-dependent epimerase/dehydratase family protein [Actinobacteria bacterium]|nr:NAD-dependent epimerase/dehydratase family protein [Actinomycetota bacterium]